MFLSVDFGRGHTILKIIFHLSVWHNLQSEQKENTAF